MSLAALTWPAIPPDTVRAARAAFPKGTLALHLCDHLGTLYSDALFAALFSPLAPPTQPPWRLAWSRGSAH